METRTEKHLRTRLRHYSEIFMPPRYTLGPRQSRVYKVRRHACRIGAIGTQEPSGREGVVTRRLKVRYLHRHASLDHLQAPPHGCPDSSDKKILKFSFCNIK